MPIAFLLLKGQLYLFFHMPNFKIIVNLKADKWTMIRLDTFCLPLQMHLTLFSQLFAVDRYCTDYITGFLHPLTSSMSDLETGAPVEDGVQMGKRYLLMKLTYLFPGLSPCGISADWL